VQLELEILGEFFLVSPYNPAYPRVDEPILVSRATIKKDLDVIYALILLTRGI
jgi:hypothetical protein